MLHRLPPAQRLQLGTFHISNDRLRVGVSILPQTPADRLLVKELLRSAMRFDQSLQQREIGFVLVLELEEDRRPVQPQIAGSAPGFCRRGNAFRMFREKMSDQCCRDEIHRVPPGFRHDHFFEKFEVGIVPGFLVLPQEFHREVLELAFGLFPQPAHRSPHRVGIQVLQLGKKRLRQFRPLRLLDAGKGE